MRWLRARELGVLAATMLGACLVTACSSSPPTAAEFCRTLAQQKAQYLSTYRDPVGQRPGRPAKGRLGSRAMGPDLRGAAAEFSAGD